MKTSKIRGTILPVVTPTNNDVGQSANYAELGNQVDRLLVSGVYGTFPAGTNGETCTLSLAEREGIFVTIINEVCGRVPVYADTGCTTTADTIRLSKCTEELGVDALSIATPSFALMSQKGLYGHCAVAAKEAHIPAILYNIPARTGNKLLPEMIQVLCRDIDVIVGARDSSGDLESLKAYIRLAKELSKEVATFAGSDGAILIRLKEGSTGSIMGCVDVWPKTFVSIYNKWAAGDVTGAEQMQEVIPALQSVSRYGNLNTIIRTTVGLLGYLAGKCHTPFSYVLEKGIGTLQRLLSRNRVLGLARGVSMENKPVVDVTIGNSTGTGPEISIKVLVDPVQYEFCRPTIIGGANIMGQVKSLVGYPEIRIHRCEMVTDTFFQPGTVGVLHPLLIANVSAFELVKVSIEGGNAAFQCVKKVIELAMAGEVNAACTNALNKEAIDLALVQDKGARPDDYTHFDGRTETYATYTGTEKYMMMLVHHDFRVVHVSIHVSSREVCERVKRARMLKVIETANQVHKDMGIENPRTAAAELSPHCDKNGLFGQEEIEKITPAIEAAKAEGTIEVMGPCPPDSVSLQALDGWYDIVAYVYRDQGHIPPKTAGFVCDREKEDWKVVEDVNATLGLLIVCTSMGYGTDPYHASKGSSNEKNSTNAMKYTAHMATGRKKGAAC